MDHSKFWEIIDAARPPRARSSPKLARALEQLTPAEIIDFDAWFWAYYSATQREDLWAAVYAIRGGCSDDSFDYFRGWLIGRGEAAVLGAVQDPESLADRIGKLDASDEHMLGAARAAYRKVAGAELPNDRPDVTIPGRDAWPADRFASRVTWDDAFFAAHFPRLHERFVAARAPAPTGSIPEAQFWSILDAARAGAADVVAATDALTSSLEALTTPEVLGFDRWLRTYNQALIRGDLRTACRYLLGDDDAEVFVGFRGWLLLQGEAAVRAALRDADDVLALATHPVARARAVIFATWQLLQARSVYGYDKESREAIPEQGTWAADWTAKDPGVEELRARFPKLTAELSDERVVHPNDAWRLSEYGRQRAAMDLLERASAMAEGAGRLDMLDRAAVLWPNHEDILAARGRLHAAMGNTAAALADLDAAIVRRPEAWPLHWVRSRVRLARGDHAGALADARQAAPRVEDARAWLVTQAPSSPKRVRHPKFGDGTVVSEDATSSEPKLVIDFPAGRKTIASRFVSSLD